MATGGHPSTSRLASSTSSPLFSSFSNSSSTNQEELSGAYYIRSLVKKHLMSSSSSPARSLHEDHHLNTMANTTIPHDHHRPQTQQEQAEQPPVAMKPLVKKQARRRTHASRPYQERLLNMAEARREIVNALKIHRANMRHQPCTYQHQADTLPPLRQSPLQQLQQQEQQRQEVQVVFQDRSQAVEEGGALLAPASYASYSDHQLRNPLAHWISSAAPAGSCYSSPILPYYDTPLEAPLPTAMGDLEQLARSLPAQPLGLNLSFQGFGGSVVDGSRDCEGLFGVPVIQSTSPAASSYSSPATEMASGTYGSPVLISTAEKYSSSVDAPAALIAPVLDDGGTQSAGETQGVEWWGEATTAWWSKALLESMEIGGEVAEGGAVGCTPEDVAAAAAGLPAAEWRWLCDDSVGEQGTVTGTDDKPPDFIEMLADGDYYACCYDDGRCRSDGCDGITLPCMDGIGDIEGSDGEWFSCS
ncbi:hypothetical protein SEVIR_2G399300v4 [Setaria viridis]|uniref:Uncharacterized protein n=1 Tax=Setaria viridis TaxID=4556 RepID=A0A4U6W0B8_SETVI|nr:hormone receptor 4-like [Setaria viridis]TKW35808.1 hypothetical protein SEVIR_2G399300v2 [Setaria viridis]